MTEIIESSRLIEQVIEKHRRFLETFNSEFKELDGKLSAIKQQSDSIKKEAETTESRITVLAEKYHLLFYRAKKQREELSSAALEKMRAGKAAGIQEFGRPVGRIEEFEKRLQTSKNIDDEEKAIAEIKKLLYDAESVAKRAGVLIAFKGVIDLLNEANSSHKELQSLQDKPKEHTGLVKEFDRQTGELEGRYNWLKHRIESHSNALAYWDKQKGGIKID